MKLSRRKTDLEFFATHQVESHPEEIAHNGSVWAVSYADLLMVLMSFFVIFYEAKNESADKSSLHQIAVSLGLKNETQGPLQDQTSQPTNPKELDSNKTGSLKVFERLKSSFGTKVDMEGDILTVHFDSEMFPTASYSLNAEAKQQLQRFSQIIKDQTKDLQITVVGHTDNRKLRFRNKYLADNFDLSSLRALSVVRLLVSEGLPAASLSAQGSADNQLAQRSMTITIKQKGK